ncbi:MAG TPA: hypothetical protein VK548_03780 [Candidatus Acidoferrum sp.]|nr:hypothetical protein [Candidatus Acidoferrum sp.]
MPRTIRAVFRHPWNLPEGRGFLDSDPRVRTLRRVIVTYPEVRHIQPDRISLEAGTDPRTLETVTKFLQRQQWLVSEVVTE